MGTEIEIEVDNMAAKGNNGQHMAISEAAPANLSGVAKLNDEFGGIGATGWAKRIVPEGNQILFKDRDPQVLVDSLTVRLLGGRAVKMLFIEESNTMIKSYDGKMTTDGEPVGMYPGLRDCMEIDFMYDNGEGEEVEHQANLSPTSRYAFDEYAGKLKKAKRPAELGPNPVDGKPVGLKVSEVDTIITVVRAVSKQNIRYSKFQFTCKELGGLPTPQTQGA